MNQLNVFSSVGVLMVYKLIYNKLFDVFQVDPNLLWDGFGLVVLWLQPQKSPLGPL